MRLQKAVEEKFVGGERFEPASVEFIRWLHFEFYRDAPREMLLLKGDGREIEMKPGGFRSGMEHDVAVGRHHPPSGSSIESFMAHFEGRYRFADLGPAERILAMAAAHHRFNFIHPFLDGNGRVSRLMSHAMGLMAGIGSHGLWSISRGLARGLANKSEYKMMLDSADSPRQDDLDGRGNLSRKALQEFTLWFLKVCLDQVTFMNSLFELGELSKRLRRYVERKSEMKPEAFYILEHLVLRGEMARGDAARVTGLPERTARNVLADLLRDNIIASETPKSQVFLHFSVKAAEILFPQLYPES
jgi:Fic family protein